MIEDGRGQGAYRDSSKESNDFVTVKDDNITMPQLVRAFVHAGVRSVCLVEVNGLKDLERTLAMVHKYLVVEVCAVIAVHGKATGLCEGVNDSGMSVVLTTSLNSTIAET